MKLCLILLILLWKNVDSSTTQKECSKLPTSEHAFVLEEFKKAEYQKGDVIFFSCAPGYTTHLNTTYICTDMGWRAVTIGQCSEHTGPVALSCRQPPPLENGYSQPLSLQYESGQRVRYWCNESYTMRGGPYRTCTNGQWTGDIQCISIFCEKPLIDNGNAQGDKQQFKENEFLRYSCHLGYKKVDGRPSTCRKLGLTPQWIPRPECEPLTCKLSYNPPGTTTYDPQDQLVFRPGQTVRVSCGEKEWVKSTELRSAQIVCQDTGLWDFPPECQPIKCAPISVHDNVQVNGDIYEPTFGNVLQFSCKERSQVLLGEMELFCDENGKWNNEPPTCKEISCEKPLINNGNAQGDKQHFKENEVLRYSCNLGYKKVDGRPSMCRKLGLTAQWIPRPECESLTCKLSYNPPGTTTYDPQDQLVFRPGQTVRVSCGEKEWVKSSELRSAQIECQDTGLWDFPPECQLFTCLRHGEHVVQWERSWNAIEIGDTLWYWCENGYDRTTDSRAECTRQGWQPDPLCKARGCVRPSNRDAVISDSRLKERYDHDDTVHFQCSYDPDTSFTVTCHFGRWTEGQRCEAKLCTTQPVLDNAEMVDRRKQTYSTGDRVIFRCKDKTDIFTVTCHIGEWRTTSNCETIICEKPLIDNGVVLGDKQKFKENEFLRYSCHPGYKKVDERPSVCRKLGLTAQWIPRPECELLICKLSYNPPGTTTYDPQDQLIFRPGQTVRVSCGEKEWVKSTELRTAQIECQHTGLWDFPPECQLFTCLRHGEHVDRWERSWNAIEMGDTLWYWCENGYDKTTDSRAVCTRQGWQPDPLCKARGCVRPSNRDAVISDSRLKERYDHDDTVHFQCSNDPDTSFTVTCHFGRWTEGQRCEAKPCTTQPVLDNAEMVDRRKQTYSNGEGVRFRCKDKTDIFTVTCHIGEWRTTSNCETGQ